jgi:hypothetical protein
VRSYFSICFVAYWRLLTVAIKAVLRLFSTKSNLTHSSGIFCSKTVQYVQISTIFARYLCCIFLSIKIHLNNIISAIWFLFISIFYLFHICNMRS